MKDAIIGTIVVYLHGLGFTQFTAYDLYHAISILEDTDFGKVHAIKHLQLVSQRGNHLRTVLKGLEDTNIGQYLLSELPDYDKRLSLKEAKQIMDVLQRL